MKQHFFGQLVFATLWLFLSEIFCEQMVLDHGDNDDYPSVRIEETGPSYNDLNETVAQALGLCQGRDVLNNTRHRLLFSEFRSASSEIYHDIKDEDDMFQATVYDFTHGRVILVRGIPFDPTTIAFAEANTQPYPNTEELVEAARIAGVHSDEVVSGYMPPFTTNDFPNGTSHRILNLAINSASSSRLVSINMNNRTVESRSGHTDRIMACEAPQNANGAILNRGIPGTANLIITQGGNELWTFQAIRPSTSSGTNGAGIELRNVKYKDKTVLYQAHVPILNVEYEQNADSNPHCGPYYRDWQWQEYPLHCKGRDLLKDFRLCSSPATTIVDPPYVDGGDFTGIAISIEGQEVVLKAQMWAGWYRYTSEWRFHVDGTLRPRFGFGGVLTGPDNCVCQLHHHHVYLRLDFDIVTAGNNVVREFNKPPIFGSSNYHDKIYEIQREKDPKHQRHWEISNTRTGSTYSLTPGPNDGTADAFGLGICGF